MVAPSPVCRHLGRIGEGGSLLRLFLNGPSSHKSRGKMNASVEKWRRRADSRERPRCMVLALLILVGGQLGGCADIQRATYLPPVNPESPVAGVVGAASMETFKRPDFASVPPKPLNVPPADTVKTAVIDMVRCRRAYEAWVAANPALVSGGVAYAEGLQTALDNNPADRPTPEQQAASEAEADQLRAYAAPPPPMHPGPALDASQASAPSAKTAAATPRAPHVAAAVATPAAAPAGTTSPAPTAEPMSDRQQVAAVRPSMTPVYVDPVLAHCQ
jgi:hypothetical protein